MIIINIKYSGSTMFIWPTSQKSKFWDFCAGKIILSMLIKEAAKELIKIPTNKVLVIKLLFLVKKEKIIIKAIKPPISAPILGNKKKNLH